MSLYPSPDILCRGFKFINAYSQQTDRVTKYLHNNTIRYLANYGDYETAE